VVEHHAQSPVAPGQIKKKNGEDFSKDKTFKINKCDKFGLLHL
jgi:hypothetical protein